MNISGYISAFGTFILGSLYCSPCSLFFWLVFLLHFFVLIHSCSSHAPVLQITLVHELHVFCTHTEWNLIVLFAFLRCLRSTLLGLEAPIKLNTIKIVIFRFEKYIICKRCIKTCTQYTALYTV